VPDSGREGWDVGVGEGFTVAVPAGDSVGVGVCV